MPAEDRRIIFTFEEIYKAVYGLCMQKNIQKPPAGSVSALEFDEKDETRIWMYLQNQHEGEGTRKMEYSRDFMAAAMMLYCRGYGIPIPRMARKSVLIEGERMILRVEVSAELHHASETR